MSVAIEFRNISKVYRRGFRRKETVALKDVSFQVGRGEVCGFLGPNGAGKTTSISILMGFHFADRGAVRVLSYGPGDPRAKQQIGFLPENFAFYRYLTGPKLLALHLALSGGGLAGSARQITDLLTQVKLHGYDSLPISRYSRGMVQRLGIAQAILGDPQLLVLDEPTSGLDPAGRKEVLDLLLALKNAGKTIFLSSHILSDVEQICDSVVIIDRGQLVQAGRLADMITTAGRVELVVDQLPEETERRLVEQGAVVARGRHRVRLEVEQGRKREMIEQLWHAGCDVLQLNPVRGSLEDVFMKLVERRGGSE
jgi:ABC-2 type transport system ATP-binding protein